MTLANNFSRYVLNTENKSKCLLDFGAQWKPDLLFPDSVSKKTKEQTSKLNIQFLYK